MKNAYKTKQSSQLLTYLKEHPGQHMTAGEIRRVFSDTISTATVYRQLEKLVQEGLLKKYIIDENSPACYEYVDPHDHHGETCYHCKCERCGKLIHLECHEIKELGEHLAQEHGFKVDPLRTVLYGLCSECQKEQAL